MFEIMNIYDTANKLASEIKESEELKEYQKYKDLIVQNPKWKEKVKQFEQDRYELQLEAMQGKAHDNEKIKNMQSLYLELIKNETVKNYFDAELKFNVILADVNKIITEAVKQVME